LDIPAPRLNGTLSAREAKGFERQIKKDLQS
jgi:hypothetical protein